MNNFEKLTASPEALADFLAALSTINSPWEEAFHKEFCAGCHQEDCDPTCPHQDKRNAPAWWLKQEATPSNKDVAPKKTFKGLGEMTDEEVKEFAGHFYQMLQNMREAKQQQRQSS